MQSEVTNQNLIRVTVTNAVKVEYAYDGFGRRRIRQEYRWSAGGWTNTSETRYVYDGMAVLQERDGNNHPLVTYTRGLDLSGTSQGAGGIGGLLARSDTNGHAFYHADGNGNITMLINAEGTKLAQYLYDSFGNPLGMWGTLAAANTYRFSSKEIDRSTGLYYFGYRYYEPNFQRWLNPDPIGERGGINLYGYVGNDPISRIDPLGLYNPISGPGGSMGSGAGLADPSLYLPLQFQPSKNAASPSGCPQGVNNNSPFLLAGMVQAEKDYWAYKALYEMGYSGNFMAIQADSFS